jgi:TetR/AcrR family transcriptional regulator, lmrAB and yxaGH operons repressor
MFGLIMMFFMARPKNIDSVARTTALMDCVIETFKRNGYDGASLADLGAATGLAKASFYHRFPSGKPEIGRVALAESGKRFTQAVLRPLQSTAPPAARLNAMYDGVLEYYSGGTQACLMNTMTLGGGAALYGKDIKHTIAAWEKLIAACFENVSEDVARAKAVDIIIRIQGALVLARMSGREDMLIGVIMAMRR